LGGRSTRTGYLELAHRAPQDRWMRLLPASQPPHASGRWRLRCTAGACSARAAGRAALPISALGWTFQVHYSVDTLSTWHAASRDCVLS
jgi:hypothetical protein